MEGISPYYAEFCIFHAAIHISGASRYG